MTFTNSCAAKSRSPARWKLCSSTRCTRAPPLRDEHPEIPAELETICLKALSKKPEDRYASCRELAKDLGRWLAGRTTSLEIPMIAAKSPYNRDQRTRTEFSSPNRGSGLAGPAVNDLRESWDD